MHFDNGCTIDYRKLTSLHKTITFHRFSKEKISDIWVSQHCRNRHEVEEGNSQHKSVMGSEARKLDLPSWLCHGLYSPPWRCPTSSLTSTKSLKDNLMLMCSSNGEYYHMSNNTWTMTDKFQMVLGHVSPISVDYLQWKDGPCTRVWVVYMIIPFTNQIHIHFILYFHEQ